MGIDTKHFFIQRKYFCLKSRYFKFLVKWGCVFVRLFGKDFVIYDKKKRNWSEHIKLYRSE